MLTIRKTQMDALEAYMRGQFRVRLLEFLRATLREETRGATDKDLLSLIDDGIARSTGHGITTERDISLFVSLMVRHSPRFEEKPEMLWAKRILQKPTLPGQTKIDLIYQMLAARQAPQESADYPPAAS